MTPADEAEWIAEAVRRSYRDAEVPWPHRAAGPAPLNEIISTYSLAHEEVAGLNHAAASACLRRWEVHWDDIPEPDPNLAGFLYANSSGGYLFVRRGDIVTRRRFTAAHELGHYRLHLAPELARRGPDDAGMVRIDADISESDGASLAAMERQANRFAAELLMPEGVCRGLVDRYSREYGKVSRFLIHQLAGDLLVSREAIAWRLYALRLIDEVPRWLSGRRNEDVATGKAS